MMRALAPAARTLRLVPLALGAAALLGGCAAGARGSGTPPAPSNAEWRALAAPRPAPLPGAARLSVADFELLADLPWPASGAVPARRGLTELVVAGLLRRRDVHLVERRRFAAAVEAERAGTPLPPGAPPAGISPGSQLMASVTLVPLGTGSATLEVRLTEAATGRVAVTRRALLPANSDPVGLARTVVGSLLAALDDLGRLPAWSDPVAGSAPAEYAATDVTTEALAAFLTGLAEEERWRWEEARAGYQAAARVPGFFEAEAALARSARLRLGGTLGES
jgi:hypothetical protein